MFNPRCITLSLVILLALPSGLLAGPANPRIATLVQPDGTMFQARPFGDEWYYGMETADGYTILRNPDSGWWSYAEATPSGALVDSSQRVRMLPPVGIPLHLRDTRSVARAEQMRAQRNRHARSATGFALPDWYESTGTLHCARHSGPVRRPEARRLQRGRLE